MAERTHPNPRRLMPERASSVWMYLGIALLFGSLGPMIVLIHQPPGGWLYGLFLLVFSGSLAVGWAFMFQRRGWWFLLLLPLLGVPILAMPPFMRWASGGLLMSVGFDLPEVGRQVVLLVMTMVSISIGFTLLVRYISGVERRGARASAELALAGQIHAALVPPLDLRWNALQIVGTSAPSGEMGGDLIDAVATPARVDLFLADVSGHGVRAGVVMGMLKATLRTALREGGEISAHLGTLNAVLADLIEPSMFATAVWIRFEPVGSDVGPEGLVRATVVVAGHPPVFRFIAAEDRWEEVGGESLPLGILPAEPFPSRTFDLGPGDALAIYTDGLTEAADARGRQLGISGLREVVARRMSVNLPAARRAIVEDVRSARRSEDDQTLVLVRHG